MSSGVDPVLAFVVVLVVVALLLWGVFGNDPAAIYDDDDEPRHSKGDPDTCPACPRVNDDEPPPDARAWRDPWRDGE